MLSSESRDDTSEKLGCKGGEGRDAMELIELINVLLTFAPYLMIFAGGVLVGYAMRSV